MSRQLRCKQRGVSSAVSAGVSGALLAVHCTFCLPTRELSTPMLGLFDCNVYELFVVVLFRCAEINVAGACESAQGLAGHLLEFCPVISAMTALPKNAASRPWSPSAGGSRSSKRFC
ncbi:unnamed protein product [Prorocentrum cordatum]|uniref:Secreted protein n=1 Tax=Prorocentrum cordatum TaxID=2364126 RepID=A0ABN9W3D3_9DINO|nr:unnamed protein product [Polarella glacialis]